MTRRLKEISGALRSRQGQRRLLPRLAVSVLITVVFCALLWSRLVSLNLTEVLASLHLVSPYQWGLAIAATGLSFWAIGRYDDVAHCHLATGVPETQARRAGICGIALSQMLGLGVVTGALVRWRMLPSLTLVQAGQVTLVVSGLFLAGWVLVTAGAILFLGGPYPLAAVAVWGLELGAVALALVAPRWLRLWPNLMTLAKMIALAAIDCLAAALAFWCLWPAAPGFGHFLPAFLLAMGAGLVSGTPGGFGAFEMTLLVHLPQAGEAGLVAAVLAWRAVYFVLPALLAGLAVLRGPKMARRADVAAIVPDRLAFPEAGLIRQGFFSPLIVSGAIFAAARTPHALIALRQPLGGARTPDLSALAARARREGRIGVIYKAPARLALQARRAKLAVLPLSREAWLDPHRFALEASERSALRRKLRKAANAGVSARCESGDLAELARINAAWATARGGEQGFSMGRFEAGYIAGQRIYLARQGLRPIGFASFHTAAAGWSLDLLRPHPDAPDGTAHALVAAALADAGRAGVTRFSLAAVPEAAFADRHTFLARLTRLMPSAARAARGLWQFKQAFAPRWERLYLIAPSYPAMALAGWDIRRAIIHPPPLTGAGLSPMTPAQDENEVALGGAAWQTGRQ